MSDEKWLGIAGAFVFGLLGMFVGFVIWASAGAITTTSVDRGWKLQAIQHAAALYCPDTGEWAWVGDCE